MGNVEGNRAPFDACDVLVTDGFTGNVFLKALEGMGKMFSARMKGIFFASLKTKLAALADFDTVLSLNLISAAQKLRDKQAQEEAANADPEIDALVEQRTAAKKAKDFATADRIRDELKARGIEIIDTPQGAKWRKV